MRRIPACSIPVLLLAAVAGSDEPPAASAPQKPDTAGLPSVEEATARARLLHAAFDGVLRVMHRDFFRKGDNKAIPSESLQDVFKTMAEENGVTLRWLASEETIMNVDHKAQDAFDEAALKAVKSGQSEHNAVEKDTLRYAGVIVLENQCLKCHVPERKTLENRFAALEILMPVAVPAPAKP
jgi:hypothetical protein